MRIARIVALALAPLTFSQVASAADQGEVCKTSPKLVGACFTVHGRLGIYNGTPIRIWVVGSHRMLAVGGAGEAQEEDALPPSVRNLLTLGDNEEIWVFGDYLVCPLEKEHAGWMRDVCVVAATHLVATKWDGTLVKVVP